MHVSNYKSRTTPDHGLEAQFFNTLVTSLIAVFPTGFKAFLTGNDRIVLLTRDALSGAGRLRSGNFF
jgi:hypothetical protein